MKNPFAYFLLILLVFSGCEKKSSAHEGVGKTEQEEAVKDLFVTDSVVVDDSLKLSGNLTAAFKMQTLVFPNITDKTLLDSIYATQNINLPNYSKANLLSELNKQKNAFYQGNREALKEWTPDFDQTWEQNSRLKLFSKANDFMTLQYTGDGYTGGAHGYYNELYKVFDLRTNKTLQLPDVLKVQDPKIWSRILMDHFLKNDLGKGQAEMILVKEIPLNNNFYFDSKNLYFLYNQYEIAAYAAGPVLIRIPFSEIKPFLTTVFRDRLAIK